LEFGPHKTYHLKRNLYIKDVLDSYKIDCLTEGR